MLYVAEVVERVSFSLPSLSYEINKWENTGDNLGVGPLDLPPATCQDATHRSVLI